MGMTRPAWITQSIKFAKSLHYLKKRVRDEIDFLCRWGSQFTINWYYHFWWVWPDIPVCLCNISRNNSVMKLICCMLINVKVLQFMIHPMLGHHWPFSSLNMESIPSLHSINCSCSINLFIVSSCGRSMQVALFTLIF